MYLAEDELGVAALRGGDGASEVVLDLQLRLLSQHNHGAPPIHRVRLAQLRPHHKCSSAHQQIIDWVIAMSRTAGSTVSVRASVLPHTTATINRTRLTFSWRWRHQKGAQEWSADTQSP